MDLASYDETQVALLKEECIVVDEEDNVLRGESKLNCHLVENINAGLLHRAFSVFLFNSKNELLMHQRASEKITFPDYWTNTCCSHPLYFKEELEDEDQIGVKRAARRKLEQELGIKKENINLEDFEYLTRLHYKAAGDEKWGEHEIDYVLILRKDLEISPNPNEIRDVRWFSKDELKEFIDTAEEKNVKLSPWFAKIAHNFLFEWWSNLDNLQEKKDTKTIHRL